MPSNVVTLSPLIQEKLQDFHAHNSHDAIQEKQANRLGEAIASSPLLASKMHQAIQQGFIKQIQQETNPNSTASYSADKKILRIQSYLLNDSSPNVVGNLIFVTAHEVRHSLDKLLEIEHKTQQMISAEAKKKDGIHDYTTAVLSHVKALRIAEAVAQIDGFNAVVDKIKQKNTQPTLNQIYEDASKPMQDFIDRKRNLLNTEKYDYVLKSNLELNPDMTMPESAKNIEGMGQNFFDKTGDFAYDYPDNYAAAVVLNAHRYENGAPINLNFDELNKMGIDEQSLKDALKNLINRSGSNISMPNIQDISPSKINQIQPVSHHHSPQSESSLASSYSFSPSISLQAQKLAAQCEEKLLAFCEKKGIYADNPQDFKNIAMALAAEGIKQDMHKIDQLDMDTQTVKVFILSYEPHAKLASVSANEVSNLPVQESMATIEQIEQQRMQQEQEKQQLQSQQQNYGRSL